MKWLRGIAALLCAVAIGMLPALAETGGWDFGTFEDPQGPTAPAVEQPSEPETEEKGAAEDEPSQDNPQQDNPQQDNPQQDNPQQDNPQQETLPQPNRQDSWDDDIWGNWNGQTAATPNLESPSDAQREEEQKRLEQAQKELEREQQQREEAFREAERQNARQPEQQEEQQQGKGGASQEETAAPTELVLPVREQSGSVSAVRYLLIGALLATACCIAVYLLRHPQEEDEDPDHTKGTGGD